jgi:hypothetical protein
MSVNTNYTLKLSLEQANQVKRSLQRDRDAIVAASKDVSPEKRAGEPFRLMAQEVLQIESLLRLL